MAKKQTKKQTGKQEYFRIESRSDKTTSFSPTALQSDEKGFPAVVTIYGMLPKANPKMLRPVFSYINRAEKEALLKEQSFLTMHKIGIYEVKPISFADLPDESQLKYNRKLYNQLQAKQRKDLED